MSGVGCSLAALVSAGGPVRVALRPCCLVALVGPRNAPDSAATCSAAGQVADAANDPVASVAAASVAAASVAAAAVAVASVLAGTGGGGAGPVEAAAAAGGGARWPDPGSVAVDVDSLVEADGETAVEAGAVP
ncbi:hypothetical protein [Paractinoplanes toevensis]|uniref:Uncharacterized protein n=1 Tax=Paractinoplanes toevensis TaxID=571911 RepID=A0A919W7U5_9ACTN|nr:hypothetical protein [Actinoplanes toevensis]GIM90441.1 hypothetical protein Ato02nite_022340 [Actinoplanes toevensis]